MQNLIQIENGGVSCRAERGVMGGFTLAYGGQTFFLAGEGGQADSWRFTAADGSPIGACTGSWTPPDRLDEYAAPEGFSIRAADAAAACGAHFRRAERIWIAAFPHVLFLVDTVACDVPVRMTARFRIQNRDGCLATHVAAPTRLVFRRPPAAMKFFPFPLGEPVELQSGTEESSGAALFDYTTPPACRHRIVYGFAMSELDEIPRWHIKPEGESIFRVLGPGNTPVWELRLGENGTRPFTLRRTE